MAHYAWVDKDNKVINVTVVKDEDQMVDGVEDEVTGDQFLKETHKDTDFVKNGGKFIKCSINTNSNKHDQGKTPLRGNMADKGGTYDPVNDQFIRLKPEGFTSWIWNVEHAQWRAPIDPTAEQLEQGYYWDESAQAWVAPPSE